MQIHVAIVAVELTATISGDQIIATGLQTRVGLPHLDVYRHVLGLLRLDGRVCDGHFVPVGVRPLPAAAHANKRIPVGRTGKQVARRRGGWRIARACDGILRRRLCTLLIQGDQDPLHSVHSVVERNGDRFLKNAADAQVRVVPGYQQSIQRIPVGTPYQ